MRLLRLRTDGFGPLRGEYAFDPDKVTVVVDRNEAGKSSLLSAISAALYGLEGDRRSHRVLTPLERWRPWEGDRYAVELELESGGERYVIKRDFVRGTVEVWNGRGQEVTAEFREGKDEFPIGKRLLDVDAAEFEKCALVRQSELDLVVPGDEKARRAATLNQRLERAADTRGGDTSATEAVKVLGQALRKYHSLELGFEGTIDVAIQRLEAKSQLLATELNTLDHDLAQVAGPLEELARLAEHERDTHASLARLEGEKRTGHVTDLRQKLDAHAVAESHLAGLRAEAEALAVASHLPANAEADLRETVGRLAEMQRNLEGLEARRRDEQARERTEIEATLQSLQAYAQGTPADADQCVTLASELRRMAEDEQRVRAETDAPSDPPVEHGVEPARAQALLARFERLTPGQHQQLREQTRLALSFQTEVADLEPARAASSETLRTIDRARGAWRLPGGFLAALGAGGLLAGLVVMGMKGEVGVWSALLGGGTAGIGLGALLLLLSGRVRTRDREDALRDLTDTNRRLNQIRVMRAEGETELGELARALGHRDAVELMRDWNDYLRLTEVSGPRQRAKDQLAILASRRDRTLAETRALLERLGGGPTDPSHLDRVAAGVRHLDATRQRLAEMEKGWSWIEEDKRLAEASMAGYQERAERLLQTAGLAYDPSRPWDAHVAELAERAKGAGRHAVLVRELIPQAEARRLTAEQVADLRRQLAAIEHGAEDAPLPAFAPAAGATPRPSFEVDREIATLRKQLDAHAARRQDLRLKVDGACKRHAADHPEKTAAREAIERDLERARRFKAAVELASATIQAVAVDTHRRWAEYLNQRVPQILEQVGARVEQLRFGEDLDFSVRLWNGQQISRGKAVLQLSAGARDQLHLAVRLAISEYLSKPGQPLPLLIDDVFATSDDERARAGMRMLIEHFARHHQIIVVTCHRSRHETLAALDPELYADGVKWLDTSTAGTPAGQG